MKTNSKMLVKMFFIILAALILAKEGECSPRKGGSKSQNRNPSGSSHIVDNTLVVVDNKYDQPATSNLPGGLSVQKVSTFTRTGLGDTKDVSNSAVDHLKKYSNQAMNFAGYKHDNVKQFIKQAMGMTNRNIQPFTGYGNQAMGFVSQAIGAAGNLARASVGAAGDLANQGQRMAIGVNY